MASGGGLKLRRKAIDNQRTMFMQIKWMHFNCRYTLHSNSFVLWKVLANAEKSDISALNQAPMHMLCRQQWKELWHLVDFKSRQSPRFWCHSDSKGDSGNKSSPSKTKDEVCCLGPCGGPDEHVIWCQILLSVLNTWGMDNWGRIRGEALNVKTVLSK